eukprot:GHVO01042650.1.p1 GENE.GHVO01042650.1~~GHVO01042650.1.p1  ORF type:complete len:298 (+),score=42.00 GHVO01042650.1:1-894(+)
MVVGVVAVEGSSDGVSVYTVVVAVVSTQSTGDKCKMDNSEFVKTALAGEIRHDGRGMLDYRKIQIFRHPTGEVEVSLGQTKALAVVSAEKVAPPRHRPQEGILLFNVEFGPIASPSFNLPTVSCSSNEAATKLSTLLDLVVKGSKAVDTESLCISPGESVWQVRCDVKALDDDGNLTDACALAAITALKSYLLLDNKKARISLHHVPILVTVGEIDGQLIIDPKREEEHLLTARAHIALNEMGEVCYIWSSGGDRDINEVCNLIDIASTQGKIIRKLITKKIGGTHTEEEEEEEGEI